MGDRAVRRGRWLRIAAFMLATTGATTGAAAAQLAPPDAYRLMAHQFAQCLADTRSSRAVDYLRSAPGSEAARLLIVRMVKYECPTVGAVEFDDSELRGALYAARFRREFGGRAVTLPVAATEYRADVAGMPPAVANGYVALHAFGECVVRADPAAARALVISQPATEAEHAAFAALAPRLGECLNNGNDVRFTKLVLGNVVAEAMYRLAAAVPAGPAAR